MKKAFVPLCLVLLIAFHSGGSSAETWKESFEAICAQTAEATSLSTEDVRELLQRSEELTRTIEKIDDPHKKVYLFRLNKCRNFFKYILETRESKGESKGQDTPGSE
jgi:hypothetical protein